MRYKCIHNLCKANKCKGEKKIICSTRSGNVRMWNLNLVAPYFQTFKYILISISSRCAMCLHCHMVNSFFSSTFSCQSFGAALNALYEFFETLRSALVEMINLSRRNVSLSGLNINSCVTFQEPLLFGNKNNKSLLTQCLLLLKSVFSNSKTGSYGSYLSFHAELNTINHIQALEIQVNKKLSE